MKKFFFPLFLFFVLLRSVNIAGAESLKKKNDEKKNFFQRHKKTLIITAMGAACLGLGVYYLNKNGLIDKQLLLLKKDEFFKWCNKTWRAELTYTKRITMGAIGVLIPVTGLGYFVLKKLNVHNTVNGVDIAIKEIIERKLPLLKLILNNLLAITHKIGIEQPIIDQIYLNDQLIIDTNANNNYSKSEKALSFAKINSQMNNLLYAHDINSLITIKNDINDIKSFDNAFNRIKPLKLQHLQNTKLFWQDISQDINKAQPNEYQEYTKNEIAMNIKNLETNENILNQCHTYQEYLNTKSTILNVNQEKTVIGNLNNSFDILIQTINTLSNDIDKTTAATNSTLMEIKSAIPDIKKLINTTDNRIKNLSGIFNWNAESTPNKIIRLEKEKETEENNIKLYKEKLKEIDNNEKELDTEEKKLIQELNALKAKQQTPEYFIKVVSEMEKDSSNELNAIEKKTINIASTRKKIVDGKNILSESIALSQLNTIEKQYQIDCLKNPANNDIIAIQKQYYTDKEKALKDLIDAVNFSKSKKTEYEYILFTFLLNNEKNQDEKANNHDKKWRFLIDSYNKYNNNDAIRAHIISESDFILGYCIRNIIKKNQDYTLENFKDNINDNSLFECLKNKISEIIKTQAEYNQNITNIKDALNNSVNKSKALFNKIPIDKVKAFLDYFKKIEWPSCKKRKKN